MPSCSHCGAEPSPESNFCPKCGILLEGRTPPRLPGAGPSREFARTPIVAEAAIFFGHPRVLSSFWHLFDILLLLVFGYCVGQAVGTDLCLAASCAGVLLALLVRWFYCMGITYRITTHRIDVDWGIFSKRREVLWLYEVRDLFIERPFSQRLLGTGNLLVMAFGSDEPYFRIRGLSGAGHVFDQLKVHVNRERERHVGVIRALGIASPGTARITTPKPEPAERLAGTA
ncbi:MAG: PH domain-containing protein [Planctomycetes bacterium]|nr:PH domain-containing protein [Planctomycetota bacterium]